MDIRYAIWVLRVAASEWLKENPNSTNRENILLALELTASLAGMAGDNK